MRLALVGGSYTTRSIIASAQRCINYYPEINPRNSAIVPITHYQRPGLVPLATFGNGPIRGLFQLSNGDGYCVSGRQLFKIHKDWTGTSLGSTAVNITSPVSMVDNGFVWVLVDGTSGGWTGALGGTDFAAINDSTGTFIGADRVDYIDTYLLFNQPNTVFFYSTHSNELTFDGLFIAGKTGWPDNIETIYVNRHEILLIGSLKSEVWYDAGLTTFPFAALPGAYIEHGIAAKYSISHYDISVYWLSRDLNGHGVVLRFRGYLTERISNHALEFAIQQMAKTVGISDAIGFTYQLDGHVFYNLTFPAGDQTWVFDDSVSDPHLAWHQEAWTDNDGVMHRSRANCHAVINNTNVVGDHENGTIYKLDLDTYTDTVSGLEYPIVCVRTFPHIGAGRLAGTGQSVQLDGRRVQFAAFRADLECGMAPSTLGGLPAQVSLRWSDDRGRTFGQAVLQSSGQPGEYLTQPQWLGMGIARDRVFELSHSIAGPAALNGAWVDAEVLGT